MRNRIFTAGAGAAAIAAAIALPGPAHAAEGDAQLSVLHGVPGLTVDVWVNGDRTLDDFTPGSLAGPLALPAGAYELAITASDAADASAAVIGPVSVTLAANGNCTAVANLDAAGNPTANLFTNNVSRIEAGKGKLAVRHTAAAPAVDVLAGTAGAVWSLNQAPRPLAEVDLAPLGQFSAAGSAKVVEAADGSGALEIQLSKDEAKGYQEVWLIAPDLSRLVSLGMLNSESGTFQLPAGLEISEYPIVDVSDEPVDGNPAHSSVSIARGSLNT